MVLAGALSFGAAHAQTLTVGTDIDVKPFDFVEDGQYVGFDQDLWAEISKEIDREYSMTAMDFGALIPALQTGNIDAAISSVFITAERQMAVDFSEPYYLSANGILVAADNDTIQGPDDLDGKALGSVTGSAAANWIRENAPNSQVALFPAITNAYLELRTGRVDAIVFDYPSLAYYANAEAEGAVRLIEDPIGDSIPVGIAFPKGSDLVEPVNQALEAIRADGRYDKIHEKWFGELPVQGAQ